MSGFDRAAVALLLVGVAVAGCAGSDAGTKRASDTIAPAPSANPDAESGSITGLVTDPELLPLTGVTVALVEDGRTTTTDADGRYTLNGVAPGSYRIIFNHLGYEDGAKRVEVEAGQEHRVDATLAPIEIAEEPVIVSAQRIVFFQVDSGWLGFTSIEQAYSNVSALQSLRCNPCSAVFHFQPGPQGLLSELRWEGTYVSPAGNPFVIMKYVRNWTDGSTGSRADSSVGTQVYRPVIEHNKGILWPKETNKAVQEAGDKMKVWYFVSGLGVVMNLKVDSWTSFSYRAPMPEEFRALPQA